MKRVLLAGLGGLLMAVGLAIAGLTNPSRIVGFLDFAGRWDATALLVMLAAAGVFAIGYRFHSKQSRDKGEASMPRHRIDLPLVLGSLMFGVGWGVSGLCPGPAIVSIVSGATPAVVFGACMGAGMALHDLVRSTS